MTDTEAAGFYLGREFDLANQVIQDQPVHYDPRDLTTHGVVVGMTGSGKTGLCIGLLEEVALRGIPSIIVDLKGDLCNLLLNFPEMRPEDFEPWVNPDEARRHERSIAEQARATAEAWREGLAEWGLGPDDIARLKNSADWRVYTPGSEAGRAVSVIQTFTAPPGDIGREALNDKVEATTTALLGLMNVPNDPVQSREHILVANLLLNAWTAGKDLDLPRLISQIQSPPLRKIGTFDVDMFYPEAERLKLAVTLNNLLASPTFSTWITGDPLDLTTMLYGRDDKPRQLIFYLAHLDDAQRMFFLTLLLQEVLTWTRAQPGSTDLRALLYIDEVYGYLPPHPGNPPTKVPLMTLLKQARAFGVGVLLATQNPVDLDYKALTNSGTWFVGKLRTDRDKDRLLEGLEGVAAEQGTLTDRAYLDTAISSLGNRVFLLQDVHRGKPILFQTRWTLSYLRGPVMRDQLAQFAHHPDAPAVEAPAPSANGTAAAEDHHCPRCRAELPAGARFCMQCGRSLAELPAGTGEAAPAAAAAEASPSLSPAHVPPVLPPGTVQFFLPARPEEGESTPLHYLPRLLGFGELVLGNRAQQVERRRAVRLLAAPPEPGMPVDWAGAEQVPETLLTAAPEGRATWADVPETANDPKKLRALERSLQKYLYDHGAQTFYRNPALKLVSETGESEEAFRARCRAVAAQKPDAPPAGDNAATPDGAAGTKSKRRVDVVRAIRLAPRKADIRVTHFGLAWAPYRVHTDEAGTAGMLPAYDSQPTGNAVPS